MTAREQYIYHARKIERRTFAEIGRELGITGNRVAQIYHRLDYLANGAHADLYHFTHPVRTPNIKPQDK